MRRACSHLCKIQLRGRSHLNSKEPGTDVKAWKCYSLERKFNDIREEIYLLSFLTYNGIILSPPRETITSSSTSASKILNVPRMDLLYSPIPSPRLDRHEMKEIKKGRRKQRQTDRNDKDKNVTASLLALKLTGQESLLITSLGLQ